jgi:hypothetical protein
MTFPGYGCGRDPMLSVRVCPVHDMSEWTNGKCLTSLPKCAISRFIAVHPHRRRANTSVRSFPDNSIHRIRQSDMSTTVCMRDGVGKSRPVGVGFCPNPYLQATQIRLLSSNKHQLDIREFKSTICVHDTTITAVLSGRRAEHECVVSNKHIGCMRPRIHVRTNRLRFGADGSMLSGAAAVSRLAVPVVATPNLWTYAAVHTIGATVYRLREHAHDYSVL